jgi:hypothetical protein
VFIVMLGEAFAKAAMLDRPFPFASCPLAFAALNVMFAIVTAAVTPLMTRGIVPAAVATVTIDGADAVYVQAVADGQLNPP